MTRRQLLALLGAGPAMAGCQAAVAPPAPVMAPVALAPASPPPPMRERKLLLTVNFRRASYEIDRSSMALIANLATALADDRLRGASFEVNGHADASGRLAYNIALSFLRASAIVDELHARGVRHATIRAQGFGPLQPLMPADPLHPGNRRVEVVAIG